MINIESYNSILGVTVDLQGDFCPEGEFNVEGALAIPNANEVIEPINTVNRWVREQGGQVFFSRDQHTPNAKQFDTNGGPWPVHCVQGTPGAEFHPLLQIEPSDIIINKGMNDTEDGYSAVDIKATFANVPASLPQNLEAYCTAKLQEDSNTRIAAVLNGVATEYCVEATVEAMSALARQYANRLGVFVVLNAIRAVNPKEGSRAIENMKKGGAQFITAEEIISGQAFAVA